MYQTILIGSGGTGSYALPHLVRLYNLYTTSSRVITVLDRDIVEERNLLRQGFFNEDVGRYKGETLCERLSAITARQVRLNFVPKFVNCVQDLLEEVLPETRHLTLICGADNNMARLRIHISAYILQDRGIDVDVIDSGNAEFHGQVIMSSLRAGRSTFLTGISQLITTSVEEWRAFTLQPQDNIHRVTSVFTPNAQWRERLNRGEHELGCQDNVVANPQNIAANMTAASLITQAQYLLLTDQRGIGILRFDTTGNEVEVVHTPNVEEGYADRIADILLYLQTDEGIEAIFHTIPTVAIEVQPTQEVEEVAPVVETVPSQPTVRRVRTPRRRVAPTTTRRAVRQEQALEEVENLLQELNPNLLDLEAILNQL